MHWQTFKCNIISFFNSDHWHWQIHCGSLRHNHSSTRSCTVWMMTCSKGQSHRLMVREVNTVTEKVQVSARVPARKTRQSLMTHQLCHWKRRFLSSLYELCPRALTSGRLYRYLNIYLKIIRSQNYFWWCFHKFFACGVYFHRFVPMSMILCWVQTSTVTITTSGSCLWWVMDVAHKSHCTSHG